MFHGSCLKPSLQNAMGPPICPIDHIPMQSAVLAVPTDECITVPLQNPPLLHQSWDGNNQSIPTETTSKS